MVQSIFIILILLMLRGRNIYIQFFSRRKPDPKSIHPKQKQKTKSASQADESGPLKINRKNIINDLLEPIKPEYETKQDLFSRTQKLYHESIKQKLKHNQATRRFYQYEIDRGEDLIDNIPVDPFYQYKNADLQSEIKYQKKMVDNLKNIREFVDPHRYERLKLLITSFATKKHRYERQQFFNKLKLYPGSIKGPNPEDDPVVFRQYMQKIMPESVKIQLQAENIGSDTNYSLNGNQNQEAQFVSPFAHVTDFLSKQPKVLVSQEKNTEVKLSDKQQQFEKQKLVLEDIMQNFDSYKQTVPYEDVPLYPYTNFQQYHSYMQKIKTWSMFRKTYDDYFKKQRIEEAVKFVDQLQQCENKRNQLVRKQEAGENEGKEAQQRPKTIQIKKISRKKKNQRKQIYQQVQIKPSTYSLYTYYKTLPKEIQQHPGVKITYLGLQYWSPDIKYQQKQQILNMAAKTSLPMDKFSNAIMQKIMSKPKQYLTPHLTDRIYNINPQFTWDIHEFLNEVKDEKLRTISTVKEEEKSFPMPPDLTQRWDKDYANVPVDFYDNQDGFWDTYIDEKLQKYNKVRPLSETSKKHLVH